MLWTETERTLAPPQHAAHWEKVGSAGRRTHGLQLAQQVVPAPPQGIMALRHRAQQRAAFPRILW